MFYTIHTKFNDGSHGTMERLSHNELMTAIAAIEHGTVGFQEMVITPVKN